MTSLIIDASDDAERARISEVICKHPKNVHILSPTLFLKSQMTILRDADTVKSAEFRRAADRITRLLVEEVINLGWIKCAEDVKVTTPTEETVKGVRLPEDHLMAVSIVRAGESMEAPVQEVFPEARIGKVLIQRDEETAMPKLFYIKLPEFKSSPHVLLLDPMLATGGSCIMAIKSLLEDPNCHIVESDIIFLNLISCPEGIENLTAAYPRVRIVSGCLDRGLNEKAYIVPGLGDFGDRYFGTQ
ncbi:uracil phosphoribosyl transferase, putative [Perkinsus marinus ATCC 50983]|uniref:uracil phosphoribosyltransferase n=1 Tax=Perkinsus marinus (strain ATCC 50983 / TXsc) TaxID=423536 RepID=C5KJG5_PERM5|nr:uracil phosphoribosyl transferase, putative [Perkinsus marinus ATCC 50983]EER15299.1 uracil phosphoribosyl transferase, putative [Perkinsus marinus ATCC 50983]|eukprot:XP_002783503.1 uracil phosphoribosyl transferase, putative [Perkinsus marinus ATCC 50983]